MSTPSAPDDDLLLAALEAAEQKLPLSAEAQARLKNDPAFAAEFAALKDLSGLMATDRAWGLSSGTDVPPPHLLNAILQAEVAARPDAIRQAVVNADAPAGAPKAWWARLSSFIVGGGVVVGAAAALMITVQRAPADEAMATPALQAPQPERAKDVEGGATAQELAPPIGGLLQDKAAKMAIAAPSDDDEAAPAPAEASVGGDIADAALLGAARADIGGLAKARAGDAPEVPAGAGAGSGRKNNLDAFGFVDGTDGDGAELDGLSPKQDAPSPPTSMMSNTSPPPPPEPREEAAPRAMPKPTSPASTSTPAASPPPPAKRAPAAPASGMAPRTSDAADDAPAAPPARIISADESRRTFLERQRTEAKKKTKDYASKSSASKAESAKGAKEAGKSAGPGDMSADDIREQMGRDRQLQEANGLLLTAERELGFGRFAGALDFAARAEAIAGGGLGLAPASTQVRAYVGLKRDADAARLASRLLSGSAADLQLVDGLLAGATAAENIGDQRLAERLLIKAASAENPDVARRAEAQRRLAALRGNAPANRAAERAAPASDADTE